MTTAASWKIERERVFDALRDHAVRCPLCMGPGASMPAGTVLVSSNCEPGIVLLSEWFIAKQEAEREYKREAGHTGTTLSGRRRNDPRN